MRPDMVPRANLIERLDQGLQLGHRLTLISAPAGFGKTTLVVAWLSWKGEGRGRKDESVAWLSLDEGDGDAKRFLTYLVAALQVVWEDIGQGALAMLQSSQSAPAESVLTVVINEIADQQGECILVLDDYHLIQAGEVGGPTSVNDALVFLLDHLPPNLHLVLVTRVDPEVPLARLRARGQLTELRAIDLRFSVAEAAEFFNQAMGLNLSAEQVAALEMRTEGWIAGLQLAALALQGQRSGPGHKDIAAFIDSFSGSHHFVLDYLIEEVLEQQPAGVQHFLLQTSVLDRLNGALCDELTGQENGQETLQMLERANLFIIGLDDQRHWYRYHHLFVGLLRRRLRQRHPDWLPALNRKASEWYEGNGVDVEAIEYALRAGDFERAGRLLEEKLDALWGQGKHNELQRWLNALPEAVLLSSPQLAIYQARYQCNSGQLAEADRTLAGAERALAVGAEEVGEGRPGARPLSSDADRSRLQGRVEATRALMASYRGDVPDIIHYAGRALALLAKDDLTWRSVTALTLGNAYGFRGDMTAAYDARYRALQSCQATGDRYFIVIANLQIAITLREEGRLEQTIWVCQRQHQLATELGLARTSIAGWLLAVWAETLAEMNDLEGALERARQGVALTEHGRDLQMFGWSVMCLVRILFSRGELAAAQQVINQVQDRARESQIPPWIAGQMGTWQARVWLAEGEVGAAAHWAKERGLEAGGEAQPAQEIGFFALFEYLALARIMIAQRRLAAVTKLLKGLQQVAEAGGRTASTIEILMLQALAFFSGGEIDRARPVLARALMLAMPLGFVRVFADEGRPMTALLSQIMPDGGTLKPGEGGEAILSQVAGMGDYVQQLLAALGQRGGLQAPDSTQPSSTSLQPSISEQPLLEPLSERELEVLQLIAEGLMNREIAARLYLSLNTIKVHNRNIYSKLDAHNRTQAVARARELGILSSS
jgi:LuxR family maltose regulon positive regulatory protein